METSHFHPPLPFLTPQPNPTQPNPTHSYCLSEWFNLGLNYALYEVLLDGTNETWSCANVIPSDVSNTTQWVIDNYLDGAHGVPGAGPAAAFPVALALREGVGGGGGCAACPRPGTSLSAPAPPPHTPRTLCLSKPPGNATEFSELMQATFGTDELPTLTLDLSVGGTSATDIAEYNAFVEQYRNLSRFVEAEFFNVTGIPGNSSNPGESAPWFPCQNDTCQYLIR